MARSKKMIRRMASGVLAALMVMTLVPRVGLADAQKTVTVSDAVGLAAAVKTADSTGGNTMILLKKGTYGLENLLYITAPDITVKGTGANRNDVVLKGAGMKGSVPHGFLVAAPGFTVENLSVGEVANHCIQVQGENGGDRFTARNCRFFNSNEQMLKVSFSQSVSRYATGGLVEGCLFEYTAGKGPQYYIGGVDAHRAQDWVVRGNTFCGIKSPDGSLAEHAIHFWSGSRNTRVEGNTISDCDRGIGFGLGDSPTEGGLILNNFVQTTRDVGIGLENARNAKVYNNTVYAKGYSNAIEYRFGGTTADIRNNLTVGAIAQRNGGQGTLSSNAVASESWFVNPTAGDLHLKGNPSAVLDEGMALAEVTVDIDGAKRPAGSAVDIGAQELGAAVPATPITEPPVLSQPTVPGTALKAPVLKWSKGGAFSSWCETGWYSTPAAADLNGDGRKEIVASAYSVVALNGDTGALLWRNPSGYDRSNPSAKNVGRTWPDIVVRDIDGDGAVEIVTAHSGGTVSVYSREGRFEPGWPQKPSGSELRGLRVSDLDNDGTAEIIVSAAVGSKVNTWVYEHTGQLRKGWPQLSSDSGYAYGVFNNNVGTGDINGDGLKEVIVPSDVHYICAYDSYGKPVPANPMYGGKVWGQVGVWESLAVELRGWGAGKGDRAERYRPNFAYGVAVVADVDGNGRNEVVVTGNMYDCQGAYTSKYISAHIFNGDRSRFKTERFNWEAVPADTGAPLSENYSVIENCQTDTVVEDLDGDGLKEILYPAYDGKLHCFNLTKKEPGSWPFAVYAPGEKGYEFASPPAVADLNRDGKKEVVLATWTQKDSGRNGTLYVLSHLGTVLSEIQLPASFGSKEGNGALASPLLDDIDNDGEYEVVLNTVHSGIVAYDLPGSAAK